MCDPCIILVEHFPKKFTHRYGVTAGGEALASSMASAFEGVVVGQLSFHGTEPTLISYICQMKPIEGAESEGALGFFKGVGKGLVGYVNRLRDYTDY